MSKNTSSASSRSSHSSKTSIAPETLIALPSLSCSLSALPQAKSVDSVSMHPSSSAQRHAESEAKLRKVLSKTASSHTVPTAYTPQQSQAYSPGTSGSPPLMMRKPLKSKMHV